MVKSSYNLRSRRGGRVALPAKRTLQFDIYVVDRWVKDSFVSSYAVDKDTAEEIQRQLVEQGVTDSVISKQQIFLLLPDGWPVQRLRHLEEQWLAGRGRGLL